MPFAVKGAEALTEKIAVRLTPDEKARLRDDAELAGVSVSELVRRRYFGRPIVANTDMVMVRELRRIGGLLKHIHNTTDGVYSRETAQALVEVTGQIKKLSET
ncbi:ribbon-helix-helix, copG family protein (plasmid) [Burkholderia gladioli]|uniref:plasmid mobilization protein n=1 Tax=Burkholderia gladioli TaxID=28095 RepID=UPI0005A6F66C|nr:MobB mobilization protein [Burkholderia gladioli]AJW93573.1 ribbon-helix-helix, copG family protein [Burkholderia gladioli]ASD84749.1 MobB mobilization protein [Burkholderia gladioli pv. gladioli]AWY52978.1 MobB mobilization protein [Burkholderia gladioli pv. gladioli]SPV21515.1 mobilization protein MobB [Burkholderia gladioli]